MGYGLGIFVAVVGLVLIFALDVDLPGVTDDTLGWILVLAGVLIVIITAVQLNSRRRAQSTATTTHADGSQTVEQRTTHHDPPPTV